MNILVIGAGGREHALCWAICASPLCEQLYCMPGNGGISTIAQCVDQDPMDFEAVNRFCQDNAVELVVVGPEAPLAAGIVDFLEKRGVACFGPSASAARLESSKSFTRELCERAGIPAPRFAQFSDADEARDYIREHGAPIVVKADGLAAGKGVTVAQTIEDALAAVDDIADGAFGQQSIVIEEFLIGEEASFFALVDGVNVLPLVGAQDHKQIGDGDTGPNTGGMGAYSPAPAITDDREHLIMETIIRPTVKAMADAGYPYKGVLYAGLMFTDSGAKLLEYNVRFGDPECQVLMMRLMSDLVPALLASRDGDLDKLNLRWFPEAALCVVMAASGYPGKYEKGSEIGGLDAYADDENIVVFHAGTKREGDRLVANGGRVLGVTARGIDVAEAQNIAYAAVSGIQWPEGYWRKDIGWRAINRLNER